MRFILQLLGCSLALAAASCGDVVTSPFGDATGSVGAGGGAGGPNATATAGTTTGATGGDGGAGGAGGAPVCSPAMGDCKTQLLDVRAKLAAAKACDPGAPDQCLESFQGPCCPAATNDASSFEVSASSMCSRPSLVQSSA
jgi:hypothetical protein